MTGDAVPIEPILSTILRTQKAIVSFYVVTSS